MIELDTLFAGSIPGLYDTYLVPLIFEPYAVDLVDRLKSRPVSRVLEVACGTGVVTRLLADELPDDVEIVATDFNQPMLDYAKSAGTMRDVAWKQADAMNLPFADSSFDAVVCQFGVMFFPDRPQAFSEARRVLKPGGVFIFNTWDKIEDNEFADVVTTSLESIFPDDPPRFMARTPHGYHDRATIERGLTSSPGGCSPSDAFPAMRSGASGLKCGAAVGLGPKGFKAMMAVRAAVSRL
jgi:SAM-dependent methyltransferase